jgi:hypothetical protein
MNTFYRQAERFGGWRGSLILLVVFIITEIVTYKIGGDTGPFAYVTLHFIVMPLCSVYLIVLTLISIFRCKQRKAIIILSASLIIPIAILYYGITGDILLPKLLQSIL